MPEKKLPKGVRTLRDIATKGGKGGIYLREYRRAGGPRGTGAGLRVISEKYSPIGERLALDPKYRTEFAKIGHIVRHRPVISAKPMPVIDDAKLFAASGVRAAERRKQAEILAQKAGKLGKLGGRLGILSLPFQYIEFREAMKQPKLHEIERQASARRM